MIGRMTQHATLDLPATFTFSQSSLQAFDDCPRRFWLAYAQQLPWPAVEAAPVQDHEALMRMGSLFHRLVERAEVGLDPDRLAAGLEPPLTTWFDAYLRHRPADLPAEFVEVEKVLTIPFGDGDARYRLAAKYDLIAADSDGAVTIVDWKTNRKRTEPGTLSRRWQTVVYPYVLVEASAHLPFAPVDPARVEMIYWFVNEPRQPVRFRYDSQQHAQNRERLHQLLDAILSGRTEADFPPVPDTEINRKRFCNYCVYRSRCGRGVTAGELDALDDVEDFFVVDETTALEFTLDEVEEMAF
jgi:CRISPR/Cas system-associated exonuclease Cas4 (RecB family)